VILKKKPHFVNVGMPRCYYRLWIVTQIWYKRRASVL